MNQDAMAVCELVPGLLHCARAAVKSQLGGCTSRRNYSRCSCLWWRISFFDAADDATNATNELRVRECNNADHETASGESLSTSEPCRAWSSSYTATQISTIPLQLARISQARQVDRDALEARDPAGMARWLRADPRADSDLTLYLDASVESERTD
ncbi:MAG: hypothetical protein JWM02_3081 [Frankiales bacterium]|nr:hypothetical protein [Frankiales bacterium]